MKTKSDLEQHIAVFGESGSGKTVLLSAFYGAAQEPEFMRTSPYRLYSEDGRGSRLHQAYLGMRDTATAPKSTRRRSSTYRFRVRPSSAQGPKGAHPIEALQLVWHDYPGEWLEGADLAETEAQRRSETFSDLLQSDVALILADGQRLLDNAGEEERYLKALFTTMRNEIERVRDDLLKNGKLVEFPRVWMIALSKADLLPDMDVYAFRDLIILKAGEEVQALRDEIGELVKFPEALALGEDFMLLSAARFTPEAIHVEEQVGIPLLLPSATVLPLRRMVTWARRKALPAEAAERLIGDGVKLARPLLDLFWKHSFTKKVPLPSGVRRFLETGAIHVVESLTDLAGDRLHEANERARRDHDDMSAMITSFSIELEQAVESRVLLQAQQ